MKRRLAAIFNLDMVGYSRLMEVDERRTLLRQNAHRTDLIEASITSHHGRIVKCMGDGLLAEFASAVDAVECAAAIQRAMPDRESAVPPELRIAYRIGICVGDVVVAEGDIYGTGVILAVRIQSLAQPGGICISGSAFQQVRNKVELGFEDLGMHAVKNIFEPVHVYRVLLDPAFAAATSHARKHRKLARATVAATGAAALLTGIGGFLLFTRQVPVADSSEFDSSAEKSIAVLPFENLSADTDNAYLARAIHDELLTQLAQLGDLKVISRTSVLAYENTRKPLPQIADELNVQVVLEGSVQRADDRIRVQAQLIDPRSDRHLWAQRYDRKLTNVFDIQSDIARQITSALHARLTTPERAILTQAPTKNAEAYDLYLRAREHRQFERGSLAAAQALYEGAVRLDAGFTAAHARLSRVHGLWRWFAFDRSAERLAKQKLEAAIALRLNPNSADSHLAQGYYYYHGLRDYAAAIAEFWKALELAPSNTEVLQALAYVYRRQGRFDETLALMRRVTELDPLNSESYKGVAETALIARDGTAALKAARRARELEPESYETAAMLGWVYASGYGRLDTLLTVATRALHGNVDTSNPAVADAVQVHLWKRDGEGAVRAATQGPELVDIQVMYYPRSLLLGWSYRIQGDSARAAQNFQAAYLVLEPAVQRLSDDWRLHVALGHTYAGLGKRPEAIKAAQQARRLMPHSLDAVLALTVDQLAAEILAQAGATDQAFSIIRELLSRPSYLTSHELRMNPFYDSLRDDPRFEALLRQGPKR